MSLKQRHSDFLIGIKHPFWLRENKWIKCAWKKSDVGFCSAAMVTFTSKGLVFLRTCLLDQKLDAMAYWSCLQRIWLTGVVTKEYVPLRRYTAKTIFHSWLIFWKHKGKIFFFFFTCFLYGLINILYNLFHRDSDIMCSTILMVNINDLGFCLF